MCLRRGGGSVVGCRALARRFWSESIEIELGNAQNATALFASCDPFGPYNGYVVLHGLLPGDAATLGGDEVGGVDADAVDDLSADALNGGSEAFAHLGREDSGGDGDAAEVRHLVGAHDELLAAHGAGGRSQHQVERVLGVDGKTTDLGAVHLQGLGDVADLLAVAVQRQGDEVGGGQLDGVPFEDDGGLGGIAAADEGGAGLGGAEGGDDLVLEGGESLVGLGLGGVVAGDGDVYDGAGPDVGREEDGGELDLEAWRQFPGVTWGVCSVQCCRRRGCGIPGVCLASEAPSRRHRLCRQ